MHPTLNAMVATEREVGIARAARRRIHLGTASSTHGSRGIGPRRGLAGVKTALAGLASRRMSVARTPAGREVCCA